MIKAANLDFLSCKSRACSVTVAKVASGRITPTAREVHATLSRGKKLYGTGIASALTHPAKITLNRQRALTKGKYRLVLTYRSGGKLHTTRETVTVG